MVVVAEEDLISHGRTTPRNGQASRCRHYCALRMTEVGEAANVRRKIQKCHKSMAEDRTQCER